MDSAWSRRTTDTEAARRAGGRRRYNAERQAAARARLNKVAELYLAGVRNKAEIARRLGVHRSTVCRDFKRWPDLYLVDFLARMERQLNDGNYRRGYVFRQKRHLKNR